MNRTGAIPKLFVALGLSVFLSTAVVAQTTGQMEGTVRDQVGAALPGVTVEVASSALQGVALATTDAKGSFRLVFLPPGSYLVRCSLSGYSTVERADIVVPLGRIVALQVQMQPAFTETVTITNTPPGIDVRSPELGANITPALFLALPMDRNYVSVAQAAPGTTTDKSGTVVYGSSGLEDAYFIDGINTNDIYTSGQGKALSFEFINEVQVKTGGYQAEFGRSTGGVVNVITKTGGNEFHGDAFGYYFSDALQSRPKRESEAFRLAFGGSYLVDRFRKADLGVDVGGFLLADTLWFFAAYDRVEDNEDKKVSKDFSPYGGPPEGKVYVAHETRDLWAAKLTWHILQNHSLIASAFGDPTRNSGPLPGWGLNGEESTFLGMFDTGGGDAMLHYQGVLGMHAVLDAQLSRYTFDWTDGGPGTAMVRVADRTTPLFARTGVPSVRGGIGGYFVERDTRDNTRIDASFFIGGLAGEHGVKVGAESERVRLEYRSAYSGGQFVQIRCATKHMTANGCPPEWTYYRHFVLLTRVPPGGALDPSFASFVVGEQRQAPQNENYSAFIQDSWRVTPELTLDIGIRWEQQGMNDLHGTRKLTLTGEWAPRLGFVWDFRGNGASKAFGSWGRFYETVPMTLSFNAFTDLASAYVANHDPVSVLCDPVLAANAAFSGCWAGAGSATPTDPAGVKGEYMDEAMLGAEITAGHDLVLGAKLVYRKLGRVVEDSLAADGYYIGNPGYGLLKTAPDMSYSWLLRVPRPKRTFKGLELTAVKRLSNNWQLMASYLLSKLEGNYDGNYFVDYGQSMPNISAAYDYAEFSVHNDGYLANDRRHQAKVVATYLLPFGLTAGASAYYRSGTPVSAIGYTAGYGSILYLSQRGAWDRTDAEYEADLHLGYAIKVAGVHVNLLLDIFHLLNRQGETDRDQRYNLDQTLDVIDYATGKPLPPIPRGTPCTSVVSPQNAVSCNAGFNKSNAWQDPRSVRVGLRVTF